MDIHIAKEAASDVLGSYCEIKSDGWNHNLEYFDALFAIAKEDFPDLQRSDVKVVKHQGSIRMYGITFIRKGEIPQSYTRVSKLKYAI